MASSNKGTDKAAVKRAASNKKRVEHIQTRKKVSDPKPVKIPSTVAKLSEGQAKFIWEKTDNVSATNAAIYRQDVAGAIIKINEFGLESEFGWVHALVDNEGEVDDVNNIVAMHWLNAKVKRKPFEQWTAVVTGGKDITGLFNYKKEVKIHGMALAKTRKTVLFQPSVVEPKKINIEIRDTMNPTTTHKK